MAGARADGTPRGAVTRLLMAWRDGDAEALDELVPLVYEELHRLARAQLRRERPDHTLQPTALIHEAYLRLVGKDHPRWQGRLHFFSVAAQAMRRVLVDHARARNYAKRGGGAPRVALELVPELGVERPADLVALDDALTGLGKVDPRLEQIVQLRFFAGLDHAETAELMGVSTSTVKREWRLARTWLYGELDRTGDGDEGGS